MENIVYFARISSPDADLSAEARLLMRMAAQQQDGTELEKHTGDYQLMFDENGKPHFSGSMKICVSLSHTKGAVAVAMSENPVGIDLEHPRRVNYKVASRCFTASEREYAADDARFLEVWTRKEALLKRDGKLTLPACETETLCDSEITTRKIGSFTLSFCGAPASFTLREVDL